MAILFTSPRKKQRMFLRGITALLFLLLFIISLIVFPPDFKNQFDNNLPKEVFSAPDAAINFGILDSNQVKNLEPFGPVQTQFDYVAQDKNGKKIVGKILAASKDGAESLLREMGFKVSSLQEATIGRSEPFIPYYQLIPTTSL